MNTAEPAWDPTKAEQLDGATVLVGITYEEPSGIRQEQFHGTVLAADAREGITLRLEGQRAGDVVTLPPHLDNFIPAPAGSYRLRATCETVVDPDYTATWTLSRAPH